MRLVKAKKDDRQRFIAKYQGFKISGNFKGFAERLIFTDVVDEYGNYITNSIWFNNMKAFKDLHLVEGDIVSFYARLVYFKDESIVRFGDRMYPRLLNPTKAVKLVCPARSIYYKDTRCPINIQPNIFK